MESSESKRHLRCLSLEQKVEIISELEKGVSIRKLAKKYNISVSSIVRTKKMKDEIRSFHTRYCRHAEKRRKRIYSSQVQKLDEPLFEWYKQTRSLNQPVTDAILCAKAIELNEKIGGPSDFRASRGWLRGFKSRFDIKHLIIKGEHLYYEDSDCEVDVNETAEKINEFEAGPKVELNVYESDYTNAKETNSESVLNESNTEVNTNEPAGETFRKNVFSKLLEDGHSLDDIYNANESGIYWQLLPKKTFVLPSQTYAPEAKIPKNRVTLMFCSNASGKHKLPLFVIGKRKRPHDFNQIISLPIYYKAQKNGRMDALLFYEWFRDIFITEVTKYKLQNHLNRNTVLLVDNAPPHYYYDLNNLNENFKIIFLPSNVNPSIQPMDQGVISTFKNTYRKYILEDLISQPGNNKINSFLKNVTLADAAYYFVKAWNEIKEAQLRRGWKFLLSEMDDTHLGNVDTIDVDKSFDIDSLRKIPEYQNFNDVNLHNWLACDANDIGHSMVNESESTVGEIEVEEAEDETTTEQAFEGFMTFFKWTKNQKDLNFDSINMLYNIKSKFFNKTTDSAT